MRFKLFNITLSKAEISYLESIVKDNEFKCCHYERLRNLLRHLRLKNSVGKINRNLKKTNKHFKKVKNHFKKFGEEMGSLSEKIKNTKSENEY